MRKIGVILSLILGAAMVACTATPAPLPEVSQAPAEHAPAAQEAPAAEEDVEEDIVEEEELRVEAPTDKLRKLALITQGEATASDPFSLGVWQGMERYSKQNGVPFVHFIATEREKSVYLSSIETAVNSGAELVVCAGVMSNTAIFDAQQDYPDTSFIIIDGIPQNGETGDAFEQKVAENTYAITYKEEQAGFLAGYAAVKDGYKKLGVMGGMKIPPVIRYGLGFVQGADVAAKEMGLRDVEVKYTYLGAFLPDPKVESLAADWYKSGTELIFACNGGSGDSVISAAESDGGKVICVDIDQSAKSQTVVSSAVKMLENSVYAGVEAYCAGKFPGGQSVNLGVEVGGCALAMQTSRFNTFSQADYDKIVAKLASGEITVLTGANDGQPLELKDLPTTATVTEIIA